MAFPSSCAYSTQSDEENAFEPAMIFREPTFNEFLSPSSLGPAICYPHGGSMPMVTNQPKGDPYASFASRLSFDSKESIATAATLDPTPGQIAWFPPGTEDGLGSILTEEPEIINALQTNNEISWHSSSSSFDASYTSTLDPETLSFAHNVKANFQANTTTPDAIPPEEGWGVTRQVSFSSENPTILDFVVPAVGITGPSYPLENIQVVDPGITQSPPYVPSPSVEQLINSMEPVHTCQWKDPDGTVCGDLVTRGSLPEHLCKHGIKNQTRDYPTRCHWVGCKRQRNMNRESIVRHIREVHLRIRRVPKRAKSLSQMRRLTHYV